MKKCTEQKIVFVCIVTVFAFAAIYYRYKQLMNDVVIAQYFDSATDSLDWQTVYIRAIVPRDGYRELWTLNAIRTYVIIRSHNIPNRIDILIYDSIETLRKCEEYIEVSFWK